MRESPMAEPADLVKFASDGAFAVNESLQVVAWNDGASELLGYSAGEAIGRRCYDLVHGVLASGEPLCSPMCQATLCFGRCQPFAIPSCRVRHKDGRPVSVSLSTLVVPGGIEARPASGTVAIIFVREHQTRPLQALPDLPLRIYAFGQFGLAVGERGLAVGSWSRKQAVTLLKYLLTQIGHPVHRERLIECLWPEVDEDRGRKRLKVTMYFLRRQLRAAGLREEVLETTGMAYLLRPELVWVDAEAFERFVAEGWALHRQRKWEEALRSYEAAQHLYRGDYLEEDAYADWCAEERERLREVYLEMLARMGECYAERGHFAEAAQVCRTALVRDPCRESFHQALMVYLVGLGRPDWAVAQYQRCREVLARELGVEPMPETERLYRRIQKGEPITGNSPRIGGRRSE